MQPKRKRSGCRVMTDVVTICLSIALSILSWGETAAAKMTAHFIDVGQGGGVFIQKEGKNILYDCGDISAGETVTDYLGAIDVSKIDVLIISHAHRDHMGGCLHVLKKIRVGTVYHNGSKASTGIWRKFLKEMGRVGKVQVVERDLKIDGIEIFVGYDSRGERFSKEADNSVLVRLVDKSVRIMLTGDCEAVCEKEVSKTSDVQSDILNVGHHGSKASSSMEFLKKVKPKVAVIQAGKDNQYGHPTKPVLRRLREIGAQIYRTDKDGGIVIMSDGKSYKVEKEK